ncbi:MAG: ZIP family metal transporter [Ignavibacteria bacterium]|jgi:ZIP family zinc transporter
MQILFPILTSISTFTGGLFTINFKNKLHLIMGFAGGVILGVVCFDVLPAIIELINKNSFSSTYAMIALISGFLIFHIYEKVFAAHYSHEINYVEHKHPQVGVLSALALIIYSLIDGISIGLGFKVSQSIGIFVSLAIISYDFTDGINIVTLMLLNNNTVKKSRIFLFFDALAPIVGFLVTTFLDIPNYYIFLYLSFFAGFLIYISASDILPQAHKNKDSLKIIGLTVFGIIFIFLITRVI